MPLAKPFGEIHCPHCHRWFRSPVQFGNHQAFIASALIGTLVGCSRCGQRTGYERENMRWRTPDGGLVGSKS